MTYKTYQGEPRPLCRACGRPIRKRTSSFWPHHEVSSDDQWRSRVIGKRYSESGAVSYYILWDGRTYVDQFFCTNRCAMAFGRLAAKGDYVTSVAYSDALKRQKGEKVK